MGGSEAASPFRVAPRTAWGSRPEPGLDSPQQVAGKGLPGCGQVGPAQSPTLAPLSTPPLPVCPRGSREGPSDQRPTQEAFLQEVPNELALGREDW